MKDKAIFNHRQLWKLALPMMIANISTPMLGLVDTAVMGHQESAEYLGGVAIGGLIFNFIYWGFGFLRMGTTGLTAQAFGNQNHPEIRAILLRALMLALLLAFVLLLLQKPIQLFSFWIIDSSSAVQQLASEYFSIRIYSSPATLCLYALTGWFLGMQNVLKPLIIVLTSNICNIILDLILVVHLKMGITGVALATVCAEYIGLFIGLVLLFKQCKTLPGVWQWSLIWVPVRLKAMLTLNHNIFIRTLCLIFAFAFFTAQSAAYGDVILAANTVLLNFQTFMAYALDGYAHAAEALVGRALGACNKILLKQAILTAALWSFMVAVGFSLIYAVYGEHIINLLSDIKNVRLEANQYLPWQFILPIISFICYLLDGVFIGATLAKEMRNTMLFSLLCCYLPTWYFTQDLQNHGLWLALAIFMLARSLTMAWVFNQKKRALISF